MNMSWIVLASTVVAALAIAVGTILPALAMGRAIAQALDSLARQPEAERSITRTLFIGLGPGKVSLKDLIKSAVGSPKDSKKHSILRFSSRRREKRRR